MDKNICIILTVNSNLELIQETLLKLNKIEFINELFVISNSAEIEDIKDLINKNILITNPKIEVKRFSNFVEGINICLSKSKSPFSLILNDGNYLNDKALYELLNIFNEDITTKVIYTNSICVNKENKFLSYYPADKLENLLEPSSYLKPVIGSSVLFRTEIFQEIGFFDSNFKYHFIFEYITRCMIQNNKYVKYNTNFLSFNRLNSFLEIDGLDHYKKSVEFLDIYHLLNRNNTDYIEKRFLQLVHKKNYKKIFKEIYNIKISKTTVEKIELLFSKIKDNKNINNFEIHDGIPQQLQLILNNRPDLKNLYFHLKKYERQFCSWLINYGFKEYPRLLNYSENKEVIEWLNSKNDQDSISRINRAIWDSYKIFQIIFRTKNSIKFFNLFINIFWFFLPLNLPKFKKEYNLSFLKFFKLKRKNLPKPINGVNLIGYARHALGIGEDLRCTAYALNSNKLDTAIINFHPGSLDKTREEKTLENRIQTKHLYKTTILCLTAEETLRYVMTEGINNLKGKYVIGYWPWELPYWPKSWNWAFSFVNEIWVSSKHIKDSVVMETNKPVKVMPLCVDQEGFQFSQQSHKQRIVNRKKFNLDLNSTYICYCFDQNSYIDRKNPLDALKSFQMAFPPYPLDSVNKNVRLIIKTYPSKNISWEWQFLKEISKFDSRVEIIEKNMSRFELLNFYGCCDIFLSLHRAEGYGRNLAEALQLGLDLIATNWSGNTDFCKGDLYHPVPFKLVPLKPLEYPHWEGQFWAEPDIFASAKILEKVVIKRRKDGLPNKKISKEYQRYFSAIKSGKKYLKRLNDLGLIEKNKS